MQTQIGVQLYTLRDRLKEPNSIHAVFQELKTLGIKTVQLSGITSFFDQGIIQTLIEAANANQVGIHATHVPFEALEQNLNQVIAIHHQLNCPYIGIGRMPDEYRKNPSIKTFSAFASRMNALVKTLKANNLTLVYHNHEFEFIKDNQQLLFDVLIHELDPAIHLELDVHWVARSGVDPIKLIQRLSGRINVIHIKDYVVVNTESTRCDIRFGAIGDGTLDLVSILHKANENHCEYAYIEQDDTYGEDAMKCIERSVNYLKEQGFHAWFTKEE